MFDDIIPIDTLSYKDEQLNNIIREKDPDWIDKERKICLEKIRELWNDIELTDKNKNILECLICCDSLTNNNNLTLECGHKFHSKCLIQSIIIKDSTIFCKNLKDSKEKEIDDIELKHICPQCNNLIYNYKFSKSTS